MLGSGRMGRREREREQRKNVRETIQRPDQAMT